MGWHVSPSCRFPSSHSVLFLLFLQKSSHLEPHQHPLKTRLQNTNPSFCLPHTWTPYCWSLLLVLNWALIPSGLYFHSHLCNPVGLYLCILLLPQLREVHSLHTQLSSSTHHLLRPPSVRILGPRGVINRSLER